MIHPCPPKRHRWPRPSCPGCDGPSIRRRSCSMIYIGMKKNTTKEESERSVDSDRFPQGRSSIVQGWDQRSPTGVSRRETHVWVPYVVLHMLVLCHRMYVFSTIWTMSMQGWARLDPFLETVVSEFVSTYGFYAVDLWMDIETNRTHFGRFRCEAIPPFGCNGSSGGTDSLVIYFRGFVHIYAYFFADGIMILYDTNNTATRVCDSDQYNRSDVICGDSSDEMDEIHVDMCIRHVILCIVQFSYLDQQS